MTGRRLRQSDEIVFSRRLELLEAIRDTVPENERKEYEAGLSELSLSIAREKKRKAIANKIVNFWNVPGLRAEFRVSEYKPSWYTMQTSIFNIVVFLTVLIIYFYLAFYASMYQFQDPDLKFIITLGCTVVGLITIYFSTVKITKSIGRILGIRVIDPEFDNLIIETIEYPRYVPVVYTQREGASSA